MANLAKPKKTKLFANIIHVLFSGDVTPNKNDDDAAAGGSGNPAILEVEVKDWRPAGSLLRLLAQVNQMAPNRKKGSDGTIGDAAHQKTDSDHNPWVVDGSTGVVTALDITDDPKNGCSAAAVASAIVASRDPRVKYVIWNERIVSSEKSPWSWRAYSGKNPHTKHVHISVLPDKARYDDGSDWNLTAAAVEKLMLDFGVTSIGAMKLAWGKKVDSAFKKRVVQIAGRMSVDPNDLMACMAFESARSFSPSKVNPSSGARGLIQFMPKTAEWLGTTTTKLAAMTAVEQLDYVEKYFEPHIGQLRDLSDLYMAILWPKAVGKPASYVLFVEPSSTYKQNKGLDGNQDGTITKAEATSLPQQYLAEGMREDLLG